MAVTLVAIGEVPPAPSPAGSPEGPSDGLPLALSWVAPAGCPDLAAERAEIRRRVGEVDKNSATKPISAQVEMHRALTGVFILSLRTQVEATAGERVLTGRDCHELADAAALVLALLINPEASPIASLPTEPPKPPPPPLPAPHDERTGSGCGIEGMLASGALPGLGEGLAARIFYQRGHLAAAARFGGFFPKEKSAAVLPGAVASFYRLETALQVCATTSTSRRLGGTLCLGGAIVRLHGESSGVSNPGQATAYWPEALLEAAGHLRLTAATRLRLGAEARGLGSPPDFTILGLGNVYRPSAFGLRGSLGFDMLF